MYASLLLLLTAYAPGQQPDPQRPATTQSPIALTPLTPDSTSFVLGGGDQIMIHVLDLQEYTDRLYLIDSEGRVDLPLVGRIDAGGLTLEQFKRLLATRLERYVNAPEITVNLGDTQSRSVSVIGEVNAPGVHRLTGPRTLIEAISLAGGVKADAGSKVILTREIRWGPLPLSGAAKDSTGTFTVASVQLDDLLSSARPAENIAMLPDDLVSIPMGQIVYVIGEVRRAGGFPLSSHGTISILQAIALANGFAPNAATQSARILRPGPGGDGKPKEIPIDVRQIFAGKAPDVPLFANDVLLIPNSAAKAGTRRAVDVMLQIAMGVAVYGR